MKLFKYWGPTVIWMSIIFYFSSRTKVQVSEVFAVQFLIFKTLHLIEYSILYLFSYRSLRNSSKSSDWSVRYNAFLIAVGYAILDEIHQVFVPTREGRLRDIGIDLIGISLTAIYLWKLLPKAPKRLKNWAKKLEIY